MQVGARRQSHWPWRRVERGVTVLEVTLILIDLDRRMQDIALASADERRHEAVRSRVTARLPLLELEDDSPVLPSSVLAADHAVQALAGHRKLILEQDAVV